MRRLILTLLAASSGVAAPVSAQSVETSFRGIRAEANVGGDRFSSQGEKREKLGYGGSVGFDGMIGDRIVIGAEGSYWRAEKGAENCTRGLNGGSVCQRSFEEWGAAARAGVLVTPQLLVFGKAGYVNNRQRKRFDPTSNLFYVNGVIVGPETAFDNRFRTGGYQVGGGVEYSMSDSFYVSGQYVYSDYDNNTHRQRVMLGVGLRFK